MAPNFQPGPLPSVTRPRAPLCTCPERPGQPRVPCSIYGGEGGESRAPAGHPVGCGPRGRQACGWASWKQCVGGAWWLSPCGGGPPPAQGTVRGGWPFRQISPVTPLPLPPCFLQVSPTTVSSPLSTGSPLGPALGLPPLRLAPPFLRPRGSAQGLPGGGACPGSRPTLLLRFATAAASKRPEGGE